MRRPADKKTQQLVASRRLLGRERIEVKNLERSFELVELHRTAYSGTTNRIAASKVESNSHEQRRKHIVETTILTDQADQSEATVSEEEQVGSSSLSSTERISVCIKPP